jgi:hypothetical protein
VTQVVTIQGHGNRFEGWLKRCGTGSRQWEARRDGRQPGVLLEEQLACALSGPGQPHRKVVAEPPQLIVPATRTKRQRQACQVRVLFAEQLGDQVRGDLIFSVRHKSNRSPSVKDGPLANL